MPSESQLEKFVKDFVYAKISQRVYLELGDAICVRMATVAEEGALVGRGERGRGSMFLAAFWANLLQHELNFPPSNYRYRKYKEDGLEYLSVDTTDGVRLVVDMTSGKLTMTGVFVYDWFTREFQVLLNNFDGNFQRTWKFVPSNVGDLPDMERSAKETYWKSGKTNF